MTDTASNGGGDAPTDLERKIIKQIEYYFGDLNLGKDKFMQQHIKEDDGWISLETLITFNRLKALSTDFEVICSALAKSSSGLMEISEDHKKVRRSPSKPLPSQTKERKEDMKARSIYAKGFPDTGVDLDQLMEYFEKYGEVDNVFMRKNQERKFKGSVFVMFKSLESAAKFIGEEGTKYGDQELVKCYKDDYFKRKLEEKRVKRQDQLKEKEEQKQKQLEEEKKKLEERITKGAILHLTELADDVVREDLKNFFNDHGKVAWVDFEKGDKEAFVRFGTGEASAAWKSAMEAGSGTVTVNGAQLKGEVLEGDAELEHWRTIFKAQADMRDRKRKGGNKNFGKKGGGKKFQSKKKWGNDNNSDDEGPPTKQLKTE
ncbi:lupus La protein homolog [Lingula anatina]|uniref:Lupus La protein homolog n=1 Tax=Lingula anatina TaxID=7574 RepID=A0A1S3H574_LINAN|nr:lupus La protein homolog [Lingula anatina]|eukprot:XP_013381117.1 lupus La protein homolog [Lingula anatina]